MDWKPIKYGFKSYGTLSEEKVSQIFERLFGLFGKGAIDTNLHGNNSRFIEFADYLPHNDGNSRWFYHYYDDIIEFNSDSDYVIAKLSL